MTNPERSAAPMFEKLKTKLEEIGHGLEDFRTRVEQKLFHGQPDLLAQHIALLQSEFVAHLDEAQRALAEFEVEVRNAVKLLDADVATMKRAITQLQEALDDPAAASEIIQARNVARQADFDAEVARKREAAAASGTDAQIGKVGSGG